MRKRVLRWIAEALGVEILLALAKGIGPSVLTLAAGIWQAILGHLELAIMLIVIAVVSSLIGTGLFWLDARVRRKERERVEVQAQVQENQITRLWMALDLSTTALGLHGPLSEQNEKRIAVVRSLRELLRTLRRDSRAVDGESD